MPNFHRFTCDEIAQLLQAKPQGQGWIARCPAHDDKNPSLSIRRADDGGLLLKCFSSCTFLDILRALPDCSNHSLRGHFRTGSRKPTTTSDANKERAQLMWSASRSISASFRAQSYFAYRGLRTVDSPALRFHPNLYHQAHSSFPAILAKVVDSQGTFLAVHRTYLSLEGQGKAAVEPNKMMLGGLQDGAVPLADAGTTLIIGEGLETCLSAMQATKLPAWAALSASRLSRVSIPEQVKEVIILADHDDTGMNAAVVAGRRWLRQGKIVRVATPTKRGADFNDILLGKA